MEGPVVTKIEGGGWDNVSELSGQVARNGVGEVKTVREVSDELDMEKGAGVLGTGMGVDPPRAMAFKWGGVKSSDGVTLLMVRFRELLILSAERQGSHFQEEGCDLVRLLLRVEHFLCWDREQDGQTTDFSSKRMVF